MPTKEHHIKIIVDNWDPMSVLEREHIEESLRRFKPSTLKRMAADIKVKVSVERQKDWLGWFKSLFK